MVFNNGVVMTMNNYVKKLKVFGIVFGILIICCIVIYFIMGYTGLIYMKADEGEKVYEFIEDMNNDGENEKIEFSNHYTSYYQKNACDTEYTSNSIKIYVDGKVKYKTELISLGPLLNPQIVDSEEKIKQLYVHHDGGGPAPPMDCYFYYEGDGFTFSKN